MPIGGRQSGNQVWIFIGMTLRQWSPLKKLKLCAPMLSGRHKPSALQPSGKLKPKGPPRLSDSTGNMLRSLNAWRSKSSKRKARVRLTFSLLVKLP